MAGVFKPKEEDMSTIITTDELQRVSEAELCILLDRAYRELFHARPGSPGYYAALASYENIAMVLNQRLIECWRNALRL
jgi:hypothetical protein